MKTFGLLPGSGRGLRFDRHVEALVEREPEIEPIVGPLLDTWRQLGAQIAIFDKAVQRQVRADPIGRLLMTVPGIVEDITMIFAVVLLPVLAGGLTNDGDGGPVRLALSLGATLGKLVAFGILMFVVGRRLIPWILIRVARTGSSELFTLSILAAGIGIAYGASELFGVSFALGAFFAGMILKESELSHRAAADTLPLRDAFAVLFFVSVGMLFDPAVLVRQPLAVLATALIIIVGKSVAAFWIVKAFRKPTDTAVLISASLAQIGEFSFILATLGVSLGLLPAGGRDLVLAGAVVSIVLNPLVFLFGDRARARRADALAREVEAEREHQPYRTTASDHVIVVGFGRVGKLVIERMKEIGQACVVIENGLERVDELRAKGFDTVLGKRDTGDGAFGRRHREGQAPDCRCPEQHRGWRDHRAREA